MYSENDLIPLSALQHYVYCPRQCALIHVEQLWTENRFTAEGRARHDRVDRPEHEMRDGIRYEFAMAVRSLQLGIIGKTDVVEFHTGESPYLKSEISNLKSPEGCSEISNLKSEIARRAAVSNLKSPDRVSPPLKSEISNLKSPENHDRVFPVEHKRGRPKPDHCDWVQLCAQALCLEEMLNTSIPSGAIFYGKPRRRQEVEFTEALRAETIQTIQQVRELLQSARTPPPEYHEKKCSACSLFDLCLPNKFHSVSAYLRENLT